MVTEKYYVLQKDCYYPGQREYFRGKRMSKDEWMDAFALDEQGFESACWSYLREVDDLQPEVDICAKVVMKVLEIGSHCSLTSMENVCRDLKRLELESTDIAKAYGLRVAHDTVKGWMDAKPDPTPTYVKNAVRDVWNEMNR